MLSGAVSYELNPVDYVLLVTHESLQQRGYSGLSVMIIAELEGRLESRDLRAALKVLGRTYPALSAHVRFRPLLHRPYWHIAGDERFEDAVAYEYHKVNPNEHDGWGPLQHAIDAPVNVRHGPQLLLVHVDFGDGRHRLGLRWGHALMDIEGGHILLRCLHEILSGKAPGLNPDPLAVLPPPFAPRFPRSMCRAFQGRLRYAVCDRFHQPRIIRKPEGASQKCGFVLRTYDAARRGRFEELARARTAAGPLRYSRALIVALARTYLRMSTEMGRPRAHYLFPQPLPLPRSGPRPGVHGNYVTIPWIVFTSDELRDWQTADAVAARQFAEFFDRHMDEATWMMYRASSRWPLAVTRWLTSHRMPRAAAGFTGYQFDDSLTRLGDARITNLAGAGAMNCHPGWLLGRTTYGETMSLSITYYEDYFDPPNVRKFFDMLEGEAFEESP